jgi:DNA-binding CsgD family transcriptional regulator
MKKGGSGRRAPSTRPNRYPPAVMVGKVPRSDPAYRAVMEILRVVPASKWAFARVAPDGDLQHLLASDENGEKLSELDREFKRQRKKSKTGPRIAAALGPLEEFESGITLLFADANATFGILTLLRTAQAGPFTSSEVGMLTFALSSASDLLSNLQLATRERSSAPDQTSENESVIPKDSHEAAYYVLDSDMEIILAWDSEDQRRVAMTGLRIRIADRLPPVLEETVRDLTSAWGIEPQSRAAGTARPVPFLVVRTHPMSGATGLFIGVRIDKFKPANSLARAASRFRISPRELNVLAMLLEGEALDDICARLGITSSTVQDHIRSMVEKTESRNRTELVARVLGWDSSDSLKSN